MRIQTANRRLTVAFVLSALLMLAFNLLAEHLHSAQLVSVATQREAQRLTGQLLEGTKNLTHSVRAFAATGEERYLVAYEREASTDKNREAALTELHKLGLTAGEDALLQQASVNSNALTALENAAFEQALGKNTHAAVALVFGKRYEDALRAVYDPTVTFQAMLAQRLAAAERRAGRSATVFSALATLLVFCNALAIFLLFTRFYQRCVVQPIVVLNQEIQRLTAGDTQVQFSALSFTSEVGDLARSIERYRQIAEEVEVTRWVNGHAAEVMSALQGAATHAEFAQGLASLLTPLVGGGYAAIYLGDAASGGFRWAGGYAGAGGAADTHIAAGEGLVGQCAQQRAGILLDTLPASYLKVHSATGAAVPGYLILVPILSRDEVLGVMEFAAFQAFDARQQQLLQKVSELAGVNLLVLDRKIQTETLLARLQAPAVLPSA